MLPVQMLKLLDIFNIFYEVYYTQEQQDRQCSAVRITYHWGAFVQPLLQ